MPTIYDARELLHELQNEYQRKVYECPRDAEQYDLALECLDDIGDPISMFYLIWASGAMDTAFSAAQEEICDAIRSTNRDYV